MKKYLFIFLKVIFGFILLIFLLQKVELDKVVEIITHINLLFLVISLLIYSVNFLIGGLNIYTLSKPLGKKINFREAFKYYMISWSIGLCVPGKIGEFSLLYFLRKHNFSIGEGLVISVLDKVLSILVFIIISIFGFFVFLNKAIAIKLVFISILLFLILVCLIISDRSRRLIKKLILRKYSDKFQGFSKTLFYYLREKKKLLFFNIVLIFIKLVMASLAVGLIFRAMGEPIGVFYVILITSIITVISLIPISLSGLGLREVSAVYFYGLLNVNPNTTFSVYLLFLLLNYMLALYFITFFKNKNVEHERICSKS